MEINKKLLVAEGDSWFSHPCIRNVVRRLRYQEFGYDVESVAHWGHTIEHMATDRRELRQLDRAFKYLAKKEVAPGAILLSGGGNDLIGMLRHLVNKKEKNAAIINEEMLRAFLKNCVFDNYRMLINFITKKCNKRFGKEIPILIHGYDYIVPDGRDYCNTTDEGWFEPVFFCKGHKNLRKNTKALEKMIKIFNEILEDFIGEMKYSHLKYVNLQGCASNDVSNNEYQKYWVDELHPSSRTFRIMAERFDKAIISSGEV